MIKKRVLLSLSLTALLMGCSDSADPTPGGGDGALIRLRSERLSAGVASRSPYGSDGSGDVLTAWVPSARVRGEENTNAGYVDGGHAAGTMSFSGDAAAGYDMASLGDDAEARATFPVENRVYVFGLYPAEAHRWDLANTSAAITITGKEDVMAAAERLVTRQGVEAGTFQTLAFSHLLTRLEVKLKAKDDAAIASVGAIRSIRLAANQPGTAKVKDRLTFVPGTGEATFTESETLTALPFYNVAVDASNLKNYTDTPYEGQSYTLTTTAALQAYGLVAPVTADATNESEYFLAIERGDGNVDIAGFDLLQADNATPFEGSTAGYVFTVTLTYSKEYIEEVDAVVSGTIGAQDWKDGDSDIVINN